MTQPAASTDLRVVIADDQTSVREGLVLLLGMTPGLTVVGSASNGEEAMALVAELTPDAVLLDLHMPVMDGVATAAALTAHYPQVAIVVLTTFADDASVLAALRAGARSFLTKDADRAEIARTLQAAASGLSVLDPQVQAALLAAVGTAPMAGVAGSASGTGSGAPPELPDGLTPREGEILALIARGRTNPEIAAALVVSQHTVKTHVNRIFAKTGSRDRAAAMRYADEHRLG